MKKFLVCLFAIMICFSVTACGNSKSSGGKGNTLTCTKESKDDDGYKTSETMKLTYNGKNIITKINSVSIAEMDPTYVDFTVSLSSLATSMFADIKGIDMSITKESDKSVKTVVDIDFSKLDIEKLKSTMGEDNEYAALYEDGEVTVDEFKEANLKDYKCK